MVWLLQWGHFLSQKTCISDYAGLKVSLSKEWGLLQPKTAKGRYEEQIRGSLCHEPFCKKTWFLTKLSCKASLTLTMSASWQHLMVLTRMRRWIFKRQVGCSAGTWTTLRWGCFVSDVTGWEPQCWQLRQGRQAPVTKAPCKNVDFLWNE